MQNLFENTEINETATTTAPEVVPILDSIEFSFNWNDKLCCRCFTTIRLSGRYNVGDEVNIILKKQFIGVATIRCKEQRLLEQIKDFIAYVDTGYNAEKTKEILTTMYKNKNINWAKQPLYIYVLEYDQNHISTTASAQTMANP